MREIKAIRGSAKLLLAVVPFLFASGFLTAKPYLVEAIGFQTARTLHTVVMPLLFLPLLLAHTTAGLLYMLGREKRLKDGPVPKIAAVTWNALILGLAALYFVGEPPVAEPDEAGDSNEVVAPPDAAPSGGDAAEASPAADAAPAGPPRDAGAAPDARAGVGTEARDASPDGGVPAAPESAAAGHDSAAPKTAERRRAVPPRRSKTGAVRTPVAAVTAPGQVASPAAAPSASATPAAKTVPPAPAAADANAAAPVSTPPSGAKLVAVRCTVCHDLATVYAEKRTPAGWRTTVARMIALGASLNDDERAAVLRHLAVKAGR